MIPNQPVNKHAHKARVVVLLSGGGRTLGNLLRCRDEGTLPIDITRVVSTRKRIRGNDVARDAGVPLSIIPRREFATLDAFSDEVIGVLRAEAPDLVIMAGFLSKITIPSELDGRTMNIHPALLPLFGGRGLYGDRVHAAVLSAGMKVSGSTVHFVNNEYDAGPIIAQRCVPVLDDDDVDSLAARVFACECELYPAAIRLFIEGRLRIEENRVRVLPENPPGEV
jgi:formyltetrahydrofolate-dependent phosphoribosylglycinamide formyltransferase